MALDVKELEEVGKLTHRFREIVNEYGQIGDVKAEMLGAINELNHRLDLLEVKSQRMPWAGAGQDFKAERDDPAAKAFLTYTRKGYGRVGKDLREQLKMAEDPQSLDFKALNLSDDTAGGYFAMPEVLTDELIKNVVLISPMRQVARVRNTSSNSVKIPVRTGPTSATWTSEQGTRSARPDPGFGMKDIPTHEMYALSLVSRQLLDDSVFDIEAELRAEFAEQFALLEAQAFINGDGNGKPWGFLTDANVLANQVTNAGGATLTSFDPLNTLYHALADFYMPNATWAFNRKTLGVLRGIKDSQQRYIWEPAVPNNNPATILGSPYVTFYDMPDIGANTTPIALGDFRRAYSIVDRTTIAVQRLEEVYATAGQIGLLAFKRVGGQVVLSEAIRLLKMV